MARKREREREKEKLINKKIQQEFNVQESQRYKTCL